MRELTRKPNPPGDWQTKFLLEYAKSGNITHSARRAHVTRQAVQYQRAHNRDFADSMDAANEEAVDMLELEARRRAEKGTLRPVFFRGEKCGAIREFSDQLMVVLLKANRPDKYKERGAMEHTGTVGMLPIREVIVNRPAPDGGDDAGSV